ncbi:hypothetical protein S58_42540 [Bradyrhizobium oligotrophicum S58]|uniref:NADAR domain-containing protein n=1 Tax=Bradyrhizobium oligotrophicum S58 TaxID=1245469 RepID=M4Z995_9BRAD|nr:hypothetical protein S58_42540 [Bradyrhizobium oligotrophicum S58]
MAQKAALFGDQETHDAILAAPGPSQAKKLGRAVRGFDDARWTAHRFEVAVHGNVAKFGQNPALADWLRSTGDAVLVEASPVDRIWGIGLAADDPRGARSLRLARPQPAGLRADEGPRSARLRSPDYSGGLISVFRCSHAPNTQPS